MNIGVVGPGAMGCLFGGLLARGAHKVVLLDYKSGRAARIRKTGVAIEGPTGTLSVAVEATASVKGGEGLDLIIFCVKAYDTKAAAGRIKPVVGPDTLVLTLQNGLGNVEALEEVFGPGRVLAAVTGQGATLLGSGRVRHAGFGKTYIGWPKPELADDPARREQAAAVAEVLRVAGMETEVVPRIRNYVWHKLILNAAINPLGALLRLKNGDLLNSEKAMELIPDLVREAVAVARFTGVLLPAEDYMAEVRALLEQTKDNSCSMLQDVARGRRTEVAYINGALGQTAQSFGMDISVNQLLAALVEATELSYTQQIGRP
ncbi:MAG: 2-dehydropantoate 2-reductase [Pseudomonadota bacterium]